MSDAPITDAKWETLCCSGQSWYRVAVEMRLDCRQKERELTAMTEQRDGMAVLLSDIQDYTKGVKRYDYSKLTESDRIITAFDAWQEIECRIEELLQTTPTQPEPNKMEQIECDICGGENKPGAECDNFICPNYQSNPTE